MSSSSPPSSAAGAGRVAVLGGTLSGVSCAKTLLGTLSKPDVHFFTHLFDPARSIYTAHPFCEYQPNSFTVHGDVDGHSTNFREVVANWERKGLVIKSKLVIGALNEESMKFHEFCSHERYDAQGGLLELLQQEVRELERTRQVEVQRCQLSGMTFSEEKQEWTLTDLQGSTYGPYNTVLLAFDSLPRAARKASMKQLLESALPYTVDVIG